MHTFLTPEPVTLEIRNASGDIVVTLADVATTTVDVTVAAFGQPFGFIDKMLRNVPWGGHPPAGPAGGDNVTDPTEQVRVEERNSSIIIDTDPAREGWRTAFKVAVTAPSGSGIRAQSQSADVVITGAAGRLEVRTASGDIQADEVTGGTLIQSASGDVRLTTAGAELDARTASGDITVGAVGGTATVSSTSGDVRIESPAGAVTARTVSGDIRIADAVRGAVEAVAVSGDVEIGVHPGSAATIALNTLSGDTSTDFDVTDKPTDVDGAPALDIRVKTTSGDIRLLRAVRA